VVHQAYNKQINVTHNSWPCSFLAILANHYLARYLGVIRFQIEVASLARLSPKLETIRGLFARSGNQCAFPGCIHPLVNEKQKFIGQVCHIEAAMPDGERYNPKQTDEERRSYENLLILCYQHHIETDEVDEFPIELMKEIKQNHEAFFAKSDFKIDESALYKLMLEIDKYWNKIEVLNTIEHTMEDLAFRVTVKGGYVQMFDNVRNTVLRIEELLERLNKSNDKLNDDFIEFIELHGVDSTIFKELPYSVSPFNIRDWESFNLSSPNCLIQIRIDLLTIEVKYLEEYLKTNSKDQQAIAHLESAKNKLADKAQNAVMYD